MEKQHTLKTAISYAGVGLHSGREVHMTLRPAPVDTGILFRRTDQAGQPAVRASAANVTSTVRATTIEEQGTKFFTIEHLMSAFSAAAIDNCVVELDEEEPPVGDGSALVFLDLLQKAGRDEQTALKKSTKIGRASCRERV